MKKYSPSGAKNIIQVVEKNPFLLNWFRSRARIRGVNVLNDLNPEKHILPSTKVLYVGAGTGHLPQLLAERTNARVVAVDIADVRSSDAKSTSFIQADAMNLPFKAGTFDAITFVDMLHHCQEQETIVLEAKRVLKKGGKLLIHEETIPAKNSPNSRFLVKSLIGIVDDLINLQPPGVNPHMFKSAQEWIEFIQLKGFKFRSSSKHTWGFYDFLPKLISPQRNDKRSLGRFFETTGFVFEK